MRQRVTLKTLLGVAGATLLGGSVFAAGPVIDDIPTVVISDQMNEAGVTGTPATPFDFQTAATRNLFRFTDAILLSDYVSVDGASDQATLESVKFIFQETDASAVPVASGSETIAIDGVVGDQSLSTPITKADFDFISESNPAQPTTNVWNDGNPLDFLNVELSGFDPDNPINEGTDLGAIFDETYLSIYVATDAAADVDGTTMKVITTNQGAFNPTTGQVEFFDFVSESASILECEFVNDGDFEGWIFSPGTTALEYDSSPPFAGAAPNYPGAYISGVAPSAPGVSTTNVPFDAGPPPVFGGTVANAGTTALTIETDGTPAGSIDNTGAGQGGVRLYPQIAFWQGFRYDFSGTFGNTVDPARATEGTVLMSRVNVSSSGTASVTDNPDFRVRLGDVASGPAGLGITSDIIEFGGTASPGATPTQFRSYFYVHADADQASFAPGQERYLTIAVDVIDLFDAVAGSADNVYTIDKVEVLSFDFADLDGRNTVYNYGGTGFSLAAGEVAPPAATPTPFTTASTWQFRNLIELATIVAAQDDRQASGVINSGDMTVTYSAGQGGTVAAVFHDAITDASTEDADQLVVGEFWMSAATPSATGAPIRLILNYLDGSLRSTLFIFDSSTDNTFGGAGGIQEAVTGQPTPALLALESAARRYVLISEPQSGNATVGGVRFNIDAELYDPLPDSGGTWNGARAGNFTVHRVVLSTYDKPAEFETAVCN